jgi:hypothetical protein
MPHLLRHGTLVYTVLFEGPASTSQSWIQTRDVRIIKFLRRRSRRCAIQATTDESEN